MLCCGSNENEKKEDRTTELILYLSELFIFFFFVSPTIKKIKLNKIKKK